MCAMFSSTCKIIFIFFCILSSVSWDNFLWVTIYHKYDNVNLASGTGPDGHGNSWCAYNFPEIPYLCGVDFKAFKLAVEWHQNSSEFKALDDPKTLIMTNEENQERLEEMKQLGWTLLPCLAMTCPYQSFFDGTTSVTVSEQSGEPISDLQQLVAEMAVASESRKSVLNMASTFWNIIERLHIRGKDGVEMLRKYESHTSTATKTPDS